MVGVLAGLLAAPRPAAACGEGEVRRIFERVAVLLSVRVDPARPCPEIVWREAMPPDRFAALLGMETGSRVFPAYLPAANLIVAESGRPDLLAHEFVHYFQVVYWGMTENDSRDTVERQATAVEAIVREEEAVRP